MSAPVSDSATQNLTVAVVYAPHRNLRFLCKTNPPEFWVPDQKSARSLSPLQFVVVGAETDSEQRLNYKVRHFAVRPLQPEEIRHGQLSTLRNERGPAVAFCYAFRFVRLIPATNRVEIACLPIVERHRDRNLSITGVEQLFELSADELLTAHGNGWVSCKQHQWLGYGAQIAVNDRLQSIWNQFIGYVPKNLSLTRNCRRRQLHKSPS